MEEHTVVGLPRIDGNQQLQPKISVGSLDFEPISVSSTIWPRNWKFSGYGVGIMRNHVFVGESGPSLGQAPETSKEMIANRRGRA